jgi:hypothetical protein
MGATNLRGVCTRGRGDAVQVDPLDLDGLDAVDAVEVGAVEVEGVTPRAQCM